MNPRRSIWLVAAGCALASVLGIVAWAGWIGGEPQPAPSRAGVAAEGPAAGTEPGAASEATTPLATESRVGVATGIRGRLVDHAGFALAGWAIGLSAPETGRTWSLSRDHAAGLLPRWRQRTGADGRFEFGERPSADCKVFCVDRPEVACRIPFTAESPPEVELRLPADLVAVEVVLWRDGVRDDKHWVTVLAGGNKVMDGERGQSMRGVLHPGVYTVRVRPTPPWDQDVFLSEHAVTVPTGTAQVTWNLAVGGTACDILVHATPDRVGSAIGIDVNGTGAIGGGTGYFAVNGEVGARQRVWLPPGQWRIHAHGPLLAAMAERPVAVDASSPPVFVEFAGQPGASVPLELRDHRGASVAVAPDLVPPLSCGGGERPCAVLREAGAGRPQRLGFALVPLGAIRLQLEDRVIDDVHWFLPFAPVPAVDLQVRDGSDNEIGLVVERRAFVDVRACEASGREDSSACVEVWLGPRRVRGRAERLNQRWAAWLPPGDYRVTVERNGAVREHPLPVATRNVTLRLRP